MTRSHVVLALLGIATFATVGATAPGDLPDCLRGAFVGITETDPDGNVVGRPDTRDWGCAGDGGAGAVTFGRAGTRDVPVPPPTTVCFQPAAPNPASGATQLRYVLPAPGPVRLVVYGRSQGHGRPETFVVRTLVDATQFPGAYSVVWDLRNDGGTPVGPGIYRCVLEAGADVLCGDVEVRES